jgi:hypothetical protein
MVNTRNGAGAAQPNGPPPTLAQAIDAILESNDYNTPYYGKLNQVT